MRYNLIFYFPNECRNSIAALFGGITYFCEEVVSNVRYAATKGEIIKNISTTDINLVAFSITTVNFYDVYNIFSYVKKEIRYNEKVIFIAGGPHADGDPNSIINAGFDFVFSGYSEESFALFLNKLINTGALPTNNIVISETSLLWRSKSFAKLTNNYFPPLEIQRGCRYRCNYCQSCKRLSRPIYKSKEAIDEYVDEFMRLGFKRFSIISPDAFDIRFSVDERSPENIMTMFEYLKSRGIDNIEYGQFPSEVRPGADTEVYFAILSRYTKNRKIVIGAQSLSDERLKKINRGHTVSEIEATMEAAYKYGYYSIVDIIFGFPDETVDERLWTLSKFKELCKRYPSRLHVHYFLPLAGTELYKTTPSSLDKETLKLLDGLEKDGRAKGWWREGKKMVDKIIRMRDTFSK
ncbi:MAG: TIGR04013 family B12-binding domain/radical SAM domain-containing protein [Deltaproteobacteria bacterium]|nr:TIGR04013 family B12-binding domain/radical SAM domain-containing protein [Deltaproteobacteria bacterium]